MLWQELIKHKKVKIPLKETVFLWSMSEINRYIPGNIWSFLSRSIRFGQKNMTKKDIATSLVHESVFVLIASVCISLFSLQFVSNLPYVSSFFEIIPSTGIIIFVLVSIVIFIFQKRFLRLFGKRTQRISFLLPYTPQENITFLLLSIIGLLLFGFGYYFAISAVVPLPAYDFFIVSSFAVVSLLIGYLSLLTPTGLGVREGVLTIGLTQIVPVALAGFSSLFARIVLIISEVLFLALASVWVRTKNRYLIRLEAYVKNDKQRTILIVSVLVYIVYFSVASFLRYDNFYTGRFDLGNMVQTVWNTSEGRLFLFTHPNNTDVISRLAFHADFILIFFAPLYLVWNHPDLLLFIQTAVVGSGAFFLYGIARHLLKNKTVSLLISVSYLLNPSLERSNLYDFHSVVLATTFFLASWFFYLKKRYVLVVVFLFLAGITKEHVWAIIALFGVYIIASECIKMIKNNKPLTYLFLSHKVLYGISISVVSAIIFYLLVWHAIPYAKGGQHFALEFYGEFGNTPSDLVKSILFEPGRVMQTVFSGARLDYLKQLLLPVGYAPLFYPFILLFAIPDLLINLLSSNSNFHQIYYQYTATITPFLFIASVYALWLVHRYFPRMPLVVLGIYFFAMAVFGAYLYGPLPGSKRPNLAMFDSPTPNKQEIADFLERVPKDMKVAATNNAASHLSEREYIYTIPVGLDEADMIVFLVDPHPRRDVENKERIVWYMNNPNYVLVKNFNNFYAFRKNRYLTTYF